MNDNDGDVTPEFKAQAEELISKLGALCKGYNPVLILFVLETALDAQLSLFNPVLSDLFAEMMRDYKSKAAILLAVGELFKGKVDEIRRGNFVEEILKAAREGQQKPEGRDNSSYDVTTTRGEPKPKGGKKPVDKSL